MKTKTLLICLMGMFGSLQAATAKQGDDNTYKRVIDYFIESHINSDQKKLNEILSEGAVYKIPRNGKVILQTRSEVLSGLRQANSAVQNCIAASEILGATDALVFARVDFKYPEFTQQNFLTIERDENKGWKLTMVCKAFVSDSVKSPAEISTID